ncbi:MAG: hypothetical protein LQ337_002982 [Flavoplaca oasis]|nr:MAG: hypothetical protein LQ337_002982 [Flavoplaca oasis]
MTPAYVLASRNAHGSCSDQNVADLRIAFGEAVKAVQQAIQAFDNLKEPRPAAYHLNKRRTWDRQAQLLKALFNINVDKSHPLTPDNEDANVVQGFFQDMLDGHDYNIPDVTRKYWLFCGDNWLVWKGPSETNEADDRDPKRTLGETFGRGAHLAQVTTPMKSLNVYIYSLQIQAPNPQCRGSQFASTLVNTQSTTFCPPSFGDEMKSLTATKSGIKARDPLDSKKTRAHLWIHEWGHLINNFDDESSVNAAGIPIPGDANQWTRVVNLARHVPDRVRRAPDAYALFATAVFFDNYGWGTGVAEK